MSTFKEGIVCQILFYVGQTLIVIINVINIVIIINVIIIIVTIIIIIFPDCVIRSGDAAGLPLCYEDCVALRQQVIVIVYVIVAIINAIDLSSFL